jgi:aryl-alcohol dehydrogenase-like predicted oxidoreductase
MEYINFFKTSQKISRICLGTWVFGGDNWNGSEENESIKVIQKAMELGINFIDTAPVYGDGRSEKIIGKALSGVRNKIFLATKCGLKKEGHRIKRCLKSDFLKLELENSLRRLKTDYIDLYQVHWPDPNTSIDETFPQLKRFQKEGKIRYIGVSNFNEELLKKVCNNYEISSLQNEYSIIKRENGDNIFGFCKEKNINFLAYGSLSGGVLSGKYKQSPVFDFNDARSFFYGFSKPEKFQKIIPVIEVLNNTAEKYSKTVSQVILNWMLNQSITSVIVGSRTVKQIEENAKSTDWKLEKQDIEILNKIISNFI